MSKRRRLGNVVIAVSKPVLFIPTSFNCYEFVIKTLFMSVREILVFVEK